MPGDDLNVGRVGKAHGLRGDVVVTLVTNRPERVEPGATLRTDTRSLVVRSSRPHQAGKYVVAFDGVLSRESAEALRGAALYAAPIDDPDELWVHDLIGSVVFDAEGVERGSIIEVESNPASDILVLDNGALVPTTFVTSTKPGVRVDVDVPDGLFELYATDTTDE